ncbi:MAG: hypothetical protein SFU57_01750 [Gemmatimonadales bacterium]|nr:hypothetical protein [Gemmatimonadales bacterium]
MVVLVSSILTLACTAAPPEADSYRTLSSDEVSRLELVRVDSLVLTIPSGVANGITDFRRHDGRYYLLDGDDRKVHVFDAAGSHLLSFGGDGSWPGDFNSPQGLAFDRDEVIIIDNFTTAFGDDGTFHALKHFPLPRSPWSIEVVEGRQYLITAGDVDSAGGGWDLLTVLDSNSEVVGRGCRIDARIVESMRSGGLLRIYVNPDVAVLDGRVYCPQRISPIVQVMDADGRELGEIAVAPPFYRTPVDRPITLNQKKIFEFDAGFTSHSAFYPLRDGPGFVSVYSSWDLDAGGPRYWLFRCTLDADWGVRDCAMTESPKRPIMITPDGEVFLEENGDADAPPVVGIYHLSVEGDAP